MFQNRSKRPTLSISLLVFLAELQATVQHCNNTAALPEVTQFNNTVYAACRLRPSSGLETRFPRVYGHVLFKQEYPHGALNAIFYIGGFPLGCSDCSELRAIHVHQFGDIAEGCGATGDHYNPHGVPHPGHPGDFGNFEVQRKMITSEKEYTNTTLFGPLSIIGRAVVLHENADDMGEGGNAASVLNGNAGTRLACCVIGLSSDTLWRKYRL